MNQGNKIIELQYPLTKKVDTTDNFFGTVVQDPYRWLEESVTDEPEKEINQWVQAQADLARYYLDSLGHRTEIAARLKELYDYERQSSPFREGEYYYYYKNDGLQNQSPVYRTKSLDAEPELFLDPNQFSEDGTVSLSGLNFSKDGRLAAYRTSESGSDWGTVQIINTQSNEKMEDKVEWLRYSSVSWYKDGFFYSRYGDNSNEDKFTQQNTNHKVFYHKVGSSQQEDALIYADAEHPNQNFGVYASEDESFLFLTVTESTSGNALYFKEANADTDFRSIVEGFEHDYEVVDNVGEQILIYTNYNAPKYQLIAVDSKNPKQENWKSIIPETEHTLNNVSIIDGKLFARYTQEIKNYYQVFDLEGKDLGKISLPEEIDANTPVSLSGINGKRDSKEAYFTVSSFIIPSTICKLNVDDLSSSIWKQPNVKFNPADFTTEYVKYKSKDGTEVPMSIIYKKGMKRNGANPALLYGYGGFNISILPRFTVDRLPFIENGGIYAVANLRGGGEMGQELHEAGTQLNKQNVFDDFIAAAEYLIASDYTSAGFLGIEGRSNGGLLVGACMTQRPELYKVAFPIVGVLDMLRYHKFTIGHFWAADYGRSDDSTQFDNLYAYSPVHNVKATEYPATMVMTADHDDRVVPAHSFKFTAALQEGQKGNLPIIMRVDRKAGHGAGKPIEKVIEEETDKTAFLMYNLGMTWK